MQMSGLNSADGVLSGSGEDEIGKYVAKGSIDLTNHVIFTKTYVKQKNKVVYQGMYNKEKNVIQGTFGETGYGFKFQMKQVATKDVVEVADAAVGTGNMLLHIA
jgi:hypothetical protein